ALSIDHDAANRFTFVHQIEGIVDLLERHRMGDEIVDVDLALHVPVHDLRYVGASTRTTERSALPHASGDELERAGSDLLACARHADDYGNAPAAMAALQSLTHQVDVAHALEAVVGTAVGETDEVRDQVLADFLRIDEMRHAELLGELFALRVDVDADNHVRADHARALNDVQADAAQAKDHDFRAGLNLGGIDHGTDTGRDAAADVADLVEWRVLT